MLHLPRRSLDTQHTWVQSEFMKLEFHLERMLKLLSRIATLKKILRYGFRDLVSARLVCDLPILCAWICLVTFSVADKMP